MIPTKLSNSRRSAINYFLRVLTPAVVLALAVCVSLYSASNL